MSRKFITNGHQRTVDDRGRVLRRVTSATGLAGVSRDAASGIYVPASAGEWTTFLAANALSGLGNPNSCWLMQEASGNLADSIGALTLTAVGTPAYRQATAGWTRLAVTTATGGTHRFGMAAGVGPDPTTTSSLWVWLARAVGAPPGARTYAAISGLGATQFMAHVNNTPRPQIACVGVTATGVNDPTAQAIGPMTLQYDRTGTRAEITTIQEKLVGTYNAGVLDGIKGWGASGGTGLASECVYGFMYSGAGAEMTIGNLKLLLTAMGFTIPWS